MSGEILAVITALTFAVSIIILRRAVIQVTDATAGTIITIPTILLFITIILTIIGQIDSVFSFSWQSYLWFSSAGIVHHLVGRSLNYNSVRLVGANVTSVMRRIQPLVTVILGISILGEALTWQLIVGVLLIFFGIMVAGVAPEDFRSGRNLFSGIPRRALLFGFGNGLAWGISPIMVKMGLRGSDSPMGGLLIALLAATITSSILLYNPNTRAALAGITLRAVSLFFKVAVIEGTALLARYTALSIAPASVVEPLVSTSLILIIILSFLFNRNLEVFSKPIMMGIIAVVAGSIFLI